MGYKTNYVPQVPHVGYRWGTKTSTPQDGKYLIFLKNLTQKCGGSDFRYLGTSAPHGSWISGRTGLSTLLLRQVFR